MFYHLTNLLNGIRNNKAFAKCINLFLLFPAIILLSFNQDDSLVKKEAANRIIEIKKAFSKLQSASMNVTYKMYEDSIGKKLKEESTGKFCKKGNDNLYMKFYGILTIRNKDIMMVKDDSDNVVMLRNPSYEDNINLSQVDLGKILANCSLVKKISAPTGLPGFHFALDPKGETRAVEFFYDPTSLLISKVVIYYFTPERKPAQAGSKKIPASYPRLEIEYTDIKINPSFPDSQFSVSEYVKKDKKGKWTLTQNLSSHQLIDQTKVR